MEIGELREAVIKKIDEAHADLKAGIDELFKSYATGKEVKLETVNYGGAAVLRVLKDYDGNVQIFPIIGVELNSRPIQWLERQVLRKASEKHKFDYEISTREGIVKAVRLKKLYSEAEIDKIVKAASWAVNAASKPEKQGGENQNAKQ